METIKQEQTWEERLGSAECRKCQAELLFFLKEAQVKFDRRDGGFLTLKCPTCEQSTNVFSVKEVTPAS